MTQKKDIVHNLTIRLPPTFPALFQHERNAYEDANGGITLGGLFCALSAYIESHFAELSADQHREFWEWIEWQSQSDDDDLVTAVVTCFMECVVDTDAEAHSRPFMPPSLVTWCDGFMDRGQRKRRWFER